ncbi:MAG: DUF2325 domain-containing protein [Dehalococcoidia bacterium]|nr:DUF2325 domain-containing protein [Dehalococcoidia bacterium]
MVRLRADENRYLVAARGRDAALVRRVPGCRPNASAGGLQLPRQPGVILALDELFGPDGWEHPADLAIEVAEARGRELGGAEHGARVELSGSELSVECSFADKELVKLVPGYRWSAPQRRWYLPASPMALRVLEMRFGEHLEIGEGVEAFLDLRARDEEALLARAGDESGAIEAPGETVEIRPDDGSRLAAGDVSASEGGAEADALLARLDRLAGAVEELVGLLRNGLMIATPPAPGPPPEAGQSPADSSELRESWHDLLVQAGVDPHGTQPIINARLQTAGPAEVRNLQAVAGIAAAMVGDHEGALRLLRRSLDDGGGLADEELLGQALETYGRAALGLVGEACAPAGELRRSVDLLELLRADIHQAGLGFNPEALASKEALARLEYLVNDPVLRRADPLLSDCCRVAHLLAVSRGNNWMAAERVSDLLRDREIGADGFALGVGILADALLEAESMEEWRYRWPSADPAESMKDLRWLVEACQARLPGAQPESAALAALACLACIASGPADWATLEERRTLLRQVRVGSAERRYAEFLAAFSPAAAGHGPIARHFPGYTAFLSGVRLDTSAPHLLDVFMMQSGNAGGLTHQLAEDVIPGALKQGVGDPGVLLDLLDLVAESPRGDSLLNALGEELEDERFVGASGFSHEQRLTLYRRALSEAQRRGHDIDGEEAFDRLVRELLAHDRIEDLRTTCHDLGGSFKAIRHAALEVALELALEAGEPFEEMADSLTALAGRPEADTLRRELAGLALKYPALRGHLASRAFPGMDEPVEPGADLAGKRVVVVGGHAWLKKNALPVLEDGWKLDVEWLDAGSAKNGAQALGLAGGACDLIVVNTACISHAASARVTVEARNSGKEFVFHGSRGVGALLSCVWTALTHGEAAPEPPARPRRVAERRKLVR